MRHAITIVEPASTTTSGQWEVHHWPDDDTLPDGSLLAMRLPLPVGEGTPYVRNGWQSWSAPTVERLGGHVDRTGVRDPTIGCRHLLLAPQYDGDESYDVLVAEGFVAGFVEGGGILVARPRHGDLLAIRERRHGGHPPLYAATGDHAVLVDDLLSRLPGRVPARTPLGWSSWSVGGSSFLLADNVVAADLAGARSLAERGELDAFHLDDGWQEAIGDWDATTASLVRLSGSARTPAALVGEIRDAGLEAGLWIAPFCVAPHSRLAAAHPDWVLRNERGAPVPVMSVDWWGGTIWALDVTRSDVQAWLTDLGGELAAGGVGHLKVDFCYAAALAGRRHRPSTSDEALRAGMTALRAGTGDDVLLTGCGAPLWPAIGLVDCMRVGPDVTSRWDPAEPRRHHDDAASCLRNCWRSAVLRTGLHGRAWANDPDAVMLRRRHTELTVEQSSGWANWVAASGQVMSFSDHFSDLDDDALARWSELVAIHRARDSEPSRTTA